MNSFATVYVNAFAIIILFFTLRFYKTKLKYVHRSERVFLLLIFSTIVVLLNNTVLENLWSVEGPVINVFLHILQITDFSFAVIIPLLWLYYCIFRVYKDIPKKGMLRYIIPLPAVIFILFMIFSTESGLVFSVSALNIYGRGPAFILNIVFGYIYVAASIVFIIVKRKSLNRGELFPYLMVPAIPIILGLVESLVTTPVSVTWAAISLVLLEIQLSILNSKTNTDHLTGLNNRLALDSYLKRMINESQDVENSLGIVMIDIDEFKKINDIYGHVEGDRALKLTSNILRACFHGKHFIARYGGDEFTIVIKNCDQEMINEYIAKLEDERIRINSSAKKPYEINFSLGASIFGQKEITDIHSLLIEVDKMMYENKKLRKQSTDVQS